MGESLRLRTEQNATSSLHFALFFCNAEQILWERRMKFKIVTNNPLVKKELGEHHNVELIETDYRQLLVNVRDQVHMGYKLYSHPLSGSVKPNETPYKSIIVSLSPGALDVDSVQMIESSIITCDKFRVKYPEMPEGMKNDFQLIDLVLIKGALPEIN